MVDGAYLHWRGLMYDDLENLLQMCLKHHNNGLGSNKTMNNRVPMQLLHDLSMRMNKWILKLRKLLVDRYYISYHWVLKIA